MNVFEYQPRIVHAKLAMSDDHLFTVGSFNVNNISTLASIELNLDVKHTGFCQDVQKELKRIVKEDCKVIDSTNDAVKFFSVNQFFRWCAFQLIRFMLTMTTFYFRQRE
jgi:cardiolipin synthase A/B